MSTDIASEQAEAQGDAFQRAKERRWNRDATRTCRVLKEYAGKLHEIADRLRMCQSKSAQFERVFSVAIIGVLVFGVWAGLQLHFGDGKDWAAAVIQAVACVLAAFVAVAVAYGAWHSILQRLHSYEVIALLRRRAEIASAVGATTRIASGLIEQSGLLPLVKTELLLRLRETENALNEARAAAAECLKCDWGKVPANLLQDAPFPQSFISQSTPTD